MCTRWVVGSQNLHMVCARWVHGACTVRARCVHGDARVMLGRAWCVHEGLGSGRPGAATGVHGSRVAGIPDGCAASGICELSGEATSTGCFTNRSNAKCRKESEGLSQKATEILESQ